MNTTVSIELIKDIRDCLLANKVFHTPIEKRKGWDEYKEDAAVRTNQLLEVLEHCTKPRP